MRRGGGCEWGGRQRGGGRRRHAGARTRAAPAPAGARRGRQVEGAATHLLIGLYHFTIYTITLFYRLPPFFYDYNYCQFEVIILVAIAL